MTSEKKYRKDKEVLLELESQIREIKHGLSEQLKCLDQRLEHHSYMVWELHDFYQRRAQVELDYAKNLDKLVKQITIRHKTEKQRRETWSPYSTYKMWQTLLNITSKQSRDHCVLGEAYSSFISNSFMSIMDDMQRIYKKCRQNAITSHEDLIKVVSELRSSMKTYHLYHGESQHAESKLLRVESARLRATGGSAEMDKRSALAKKFRNYEKQTEKHVKKVSEQNLKALKARNEYRLSIDTANAAIRKYFVDDLPELINAMDYGYHISLGQVMMCNVALEEAMTRLHKENLTQLSVKAKDLNQRADRQAFFQQSHQIFSLPKKFQFQPHRNDQISEVLAEREVSIELVDRLKTLADRLHSLKLDNEELWKTLETTDTALLDRLMIKDFDAAGLFNVDKTPTSSSNVGGGSAGGTFPSSGTTPGRTQQVELDKQRVERLETEEYYVNKLSQYQQNSNLIARLQAKYQSIDKALAHSQLGGFTRAEIESLPRSMSFVSRPTKKRPLGKAALETQPKLFGGGIEEYVQITGQEIPLVLKSCTRIINLYGLHHQGVFRLSGAQHEINDYKNMFERGEEPVLSKFDPKDLNCISGVLKLYFRELREPLFPVQLFDELIACTKINIYDADELKKCITRLQELLLPLARPVVVVMRYLFAFLNHLTEYSDENMMDAHNLAVCFGPTLLPVPPDHEDQVGIQNSVNDLVRILIVHQENIFLNDGGPVYEKCIVVDDGDLEDSLDSLLEDAAVDGLDDDLSQSYSGSERAIAKQDYESSEGRVLSLKRGDEVLLLSRASSDWWEGLVKGKAGLVPHSYLDIQPRYGSHKLSIPDELICTSTESLPVRPRGAGALPLSQDRSNSQPNISRGASGSCQTPITVGTDSAVTGFTSSTSSDLSQLAGSTTSGIEGQGSSVTISSGSRISVGSKDGRTSATGSLKSSSSSKDTLDGSLSSEHGSSPRMVSITPTMGVSRVDGSDGSSHRSSADSLLGEHGNSSTNQKGSPSSSQEAKYDISHDSAVLSNSATATSLDQAKETLRGAVTSSSSCAAISSHAVGTSPSRSVQSKLLIGRSSSPALTTAEVFATADDHGTIKKGTKGSTLEDGDGGSAVLHRSVILIPPPSLPLDTPSLSQHGEVLRSGPPDELSPTDLPPPPPPLSPTSPGGDCSTAGVDVTDDSSMFVPSVFPPPPPLLCMPPTLFVGGIEDDGASSPGVGSLGCVTPALSCDASQCGIGSSENSCHGNSGGAMISFTAPISSGIGNTVASDISLSSNINLRKNDVGVSESNGSTDTLTGCTVTSGKAATCAASPAHGIKPTLVMIAPSGELVTTLQGPTEQRCFLVDPRQPRSVDEEPTSDVRVLDEVDESLASFSLQFSAAAASAAKTSAATATATTAASVTASAAAISTATVAGSYTIDTSISASSAVTVTTTVSNTTASTAAATAADTTVNAAVANASAMKVSHHSASYGSSSAPTSSPSSDKNHATDQSGNVDQTQVQLRGQGQVAGHAPVAVSTPNKDGKRTSGYFLSDGKISETTDDLEADDLTGRKLTQTTAGVVQGVNVANSEEKKSPSKASLGNIRSVSSLTSSFESGGSTPAEKSLTASTEKLHNSKTQSVTSSTREAVPSLLAPIYAAFSSKASSAASQETSRNRNPPPVFSRKGKSAAELLTHGISQTSSSENTTKSDIGLNEGGGVRTSSGAGLGVGETLSRPLSMEEAHSEELLGNKSKPPPVMKKPTKRL